MKRTITADRLRELLHYDPVTGFFTWRVSNSNRAPIGSRAGCVARRRRTSYIVIGLDGAEYLAHRLAWLYMTREWPSGLIDHRDTDGLNNRWENLRPATNSQNGANSNKRSNNTVGFKGVSFERSSGLYQVGIKINRKRLHLGRYRTPEEAHAAYMAAAEKLFGAFARVA